MWYRKRMTSRKGETGVAKQGTPISRPKSSEQTNPWRRQPPVFNLFIHHLQLPTAPVSSNHGCDESRQTPIRIKRAAVMLPVALAASPLQKNVGAATRPMGSSQTRGCRGLGANPLLARVAGDPRLLQIGDGIRRPIQTSWLEFQSPNPGLPAAVLTHAKQRVTSNGLRSFRMWKHALASLCASALIATTLLVFAFFRS